jgi:hypothetical protein
MDSLKLQFLVKKDQTPVFMGLVKSIISICVSPN